MDRGIPGGLRSDPSVAANVLDLRAPVVFCGASAVGGIAARPVEPLTGLAAVFVVAATVVAFAGLAMAVLAFVPRVRTTAAPAAYKRIDANQTEAACTLARSNGAPRTTTATGNFCGRRPNESGPPC